jgi:uncharacterized protein (DUF924 family)
VQNRAAEVLDFWFGRREDPGYGDFREEWFRKDDAFDATVTERFADLCEEAAAGRLEGWREDPEACLALVILLDQFPRNMFRGDARTYATDARALETSEYAIERGLDRELAPFQKVFLYMPFMHSEDLDVQRRSEELFERLAAEPGGPDVREYAVGHREIVERFGRFPHRNAILGRETTPEEAEFLTQPGSSY